MKIMMWTTLGQITTKTTTSKFSVYKAKSIGRTPNNDCRLNAEFVILFKIFKYFLEISRFAFNELWNNTWFCHGQDVVWYMKYQEHL